MLDLYTAYLKSLLVPKKRQFTDTQLIALIKKYIFIQLYREIIDIYMDSVLYQSMHDLRLLQVYNNIILE